jgi:hypothetical protein
MSVNKQVHTMRFEILTPLGFTVRTSDEYWQRLLIKHPDIEDLEEVIQLALSTPDEVRRSSRDVDVFLFPDASERALGCCGCTARKWRWLPHYSLPNRCNQGRRNCMAQLKVFYEPETELLSVFWQVPRRNQIATELGDGVILIKDGISGEPIGLEVLSYHPGDARFDAVSVELGQRNRLQPA